MGVFIFPLSLKRASDAIAQRERLLDGCPNPPLGCAGSLAHARKEWGHAAQVTGRSSRAFHLAVVRRDLAAFDRDWSQVEGPARG